MTRLERLEHQREELIMWRNEAMRNNDFFNMERAKQKIATIENEILEARKYMPMKLSEILNGKGEDVKRSIYKALLKISLACDYVAKCGFDAKDALKEVGVNDYTFRAPLEEMRKLSEKIAGFVCIPNQNLLTDMVVDDDDFIEACDTAADKRLKETVGL